MVWTEVLVDGAIAQHMVNRREDRCRHGTDCLLGSSSVSEPLELGLVVAPLLSYGCLGTLHQHGLQPRRPLAQTFGASFAGTLVVARDGASDLVASHARHDDRIGGAGFWLDRI